MKIYFCLTFFILLNFLQHIATAQSKKLDSLWDLSNNILLPDTIRLQAMGSLAWIYNSSKPDTAIMLSERQLKLINPQRIHKVWTAKIFYVMGVSYMNKGDYAKALEYDFKSLRIYEDIGNKKGIESCYGNIGITYDYQSNYPKAVEFYLKALKISEEIGDKNGVGNCYANLGTVYDRQSAFVKARECFLKALGIKQAANDNEGVENCYTNLGTSYASQGDYKKAMDHFFKALKIAEEIGDKSSIGDCCTNLGNNYFSLSEYEKALYFYSRSLHLKREVANKKGVATNFVGIGELYLNLSNDRLAVLYLDSGLRLGKEIGDVNVQRMAYQYLSLAYNKITNYKEAYVNHVKFKQLTDSIFNSENSRQLGDMKTKFEVEKKEGELKIKAEAQQIITAEEKKRQEYVIYSVAGVLLLVVVFSIFLFNRFRVTQKQKHLIEQQKVMVDNAYESLHEKNKEVMDSINYAKRIQSSLLPSEKYIEKKLNQLQKN